MNRTISKSFACLVGLAVFGILPSIQAQKAGSQGTLVRLPTSVPSVTVVHTLPESSGVQTSPVGRSSERRRLLQRTEGSKSQSHRSQCGSSRASFLLSRTCRPTPLHLAFILLSHRASGSTSQGNWRSMASARVVSDVGAGPTGSVNDGYVWELF